MASDGSLREQESARQTQAPRWVSTHLLGIVGVGVEVALVQLAGLDTSLQNRRQEVLYSQRISCSSSTDNPSERLTSAYNAAPLFFSGPVPTAASRSMRALETSLG